MRHQNTLSLLQMVLSRSKATKMLKNHLWAFQTCAQCNEINIFRLEIGEGVALRKRPDKNIEISILLCYSRLKRVWLYVCGAIASYDWATQKLCEMVYYIFPIAFYYRISALIWHISVGEREREESRVYSEQHRFKCTMCTSRLFKIKLWAHKLSFGCIIFLPFCERNRQSEREIRKNEDGRKSISVFGESAKRNTWMTIYFCKQST